MEYRPRSGPWYGPNGYGGAQSNGGYQGNGVYQGNGAYHGGYSNGTYAGDNGNGLYVYGGGDDGRYVHYGRGAVPSYGVGRGVGRPLAAAAMPSTSRGHGRGWGWGAERYWRPAPPMILPAAMRAAEAAAAEVVLRLHPVEAAERRRKEITDYLKRLFGTNFGCEVYAYGSVPLRTYLPDGDIDITVLTDTSLDDTFIDDVCHLLDSEAKNDDAQFEVKNICFIPAKVKLVKCVIDNVLVDISFNQIAGVSAICFLELVDREINRNHLFKRSIMLIKAWCQHEKNILGSNNWLLSTYALEILILHIFNLFHKSVKGPLEVLYKFLEYYGKFDWDQDCLTLNGPVPKYKSTEHAAFSDELLLSKESLKSSLDRLIVLPKGSDKLEKDFLLMYLNIVDPLKGCNNLGRSINKDNSTRIKEVFECGARNLEQILKLPSEHVPDRIYGFFATTLGRHGRGERQDLGDNASFQRMPDSENVDGKDVSSLKHAYVDEDENKSPNRLLELDDKESDVKTNRHQSSGLSNFRSHSPSSSESGNNNIKQCQSDSPTNTDASVARSYIQLNHILTSSTWANTLDVSGSNRVNKSNQTNVSEAKLQLPPFTPSCLLDLSGDLGLPLTYLRSAQYNTEALFHKFVETVKEASLAGVLDEDLFDRSTSSLFSDTDGRKLSTVKRSHSTGDVPQQSITDAQVGAPYPSVSGTHTPSSGLSLYPRPEAYQHDWFQNLEDAHQNYAASMYNPDMNILSPRTDTLRIGSPICPSRSVDKENYLFSSPYISGDNRKTRGTGTYIPKPPRELWREKSWYDKKKNERQPDEVNVEKKPDEVNVEKKPDEVNVEKKPGQVNVEKKPDRVNLSNGHVVVQRALTNGGIKQVPTSETRENGEQRYTMLLKNETMGNNFFHTKEELVRYENGWMETATLPPPRILLPHHGGSSLGNLPVASIGHPSPPAVALVTPVVTMVNNQPITSQQHEDLEFGTITPKFMEDFPPLPPTKKPVVEVPAPTLKSPKSAVSAAKSSPMEAPVSPVQSPKAGVSVTESRSLEALASTMQSPPGASASQHRPEESYQLKDDVDFPPLQAGTLYSASDFPPLRPATR